MIFSNYKTKEELKLEHLNKAQFFHERYMRTNSPRDWQAMLNRSWVASLVDQIDPEFWEESNELRWNMIHNFTEIVGSELEYQIDIVFNIKRLDCGDLHGWEKEDIARGWYDAVYQGSLDRMNAALRKLKVLMPAAQGVTKENNDLKIMRAKDYPVSDIIQFNKAGFAPCIWHSEKTPSMHYDKKHNRVHCFGCGKNGDAVDVAQIVWSCTFLEAINRLS